MLTGRLREEHSIKRGELPLFDIDAWKKVDLGKKTGTRC